MGALPGLEGGGRAHHRDPPRVHGEGPVDRPPSPRRRGVHLEAAHEALLRAQSLGRDLVADRARHPVPCEGGRPGVRGRGPARRGAPGSVAVGSRASRGDGDVCEDAQLSARGVGLVPGHGHVALGALVLDRRRRRGVVHRLPADGGLPVRIPGRVRHHRRPPVEADRDVLPAGAHHPVVARHAPVRRAEDLWGGRATAGLLGVRGARRSPDREERQGAEAERARDPLTSPQRSLRRTSPRECRRGSGSPGCRRR